MFPTLSLYIRSKHEDAYFKGNLPLFYLLLFPLNSNKILLFEGLKNQSEKNYAWIVLRLKPKNVKRLINRNIFTYP